MIKSGRIKKKQCLDASWFQHFASKALLFSTFLLGTTAAYSAEGRKPNVVVLLVDDLGSYSGGIRELKQWQEKQKNLLPHIDGVLHEK